MEHVLAARILARYQKVDPQQFIAHVLRQSAHTIAAVALMDDDLVAFDLDWRIEHLPLAARWRCRRRRDRRGFFAALALRLGG